MSDDLQDDPVETNDLRQLRSKLKERDAELTAMREQAAAGQAASRQLEFARAGVPLDDPRAKYFADGYKGDLTAEAIKAEWSNVFGVPASVQDQGAADDIAAIDRITKASTSAPSNDTTRAQRYEEELAAAKNQDEVWKVIQKYDVQIPTPDAMFAANTSRAHQALHGERR